MLKLNQPLIKFPLKLSTGHLAPSLGIDAPVGLPYASSAVGRYLSRALAVSMEWFLLLKPLKKIRIA